jgi:signal transduction histidine kinase
LDESRIVSGKLLVEREPTDLLAVLSSAVESVRPAAEKKSIVIEEEIGHDPLIVSADPIRLKQVFWNLLSNSVKFTPPRGKIEVRLGTFEDAQGGRVFVKIHDNGQGIARDFLLHVFDRFSQADTSSIRLHGGLGLGLSLVKSLLELQDGSVQAESPGEGKGATFTVLLPRMTS